MNKYYFIGTSLPTLTLESVPEITFAEFENLLKNNLSLRDYQKTTIIRRYYDILNLRSLWMGETLDPYGELDELELQEKIASAIGLPDYVYEFIEAYEKNEDRVSHFQFLLSKFFQEAAKETDPFIRNYFEFERNLRLIWTSYRSTKLGRDLAFELQYEDPEEDLIAQMLAQKDAKVFEPPEVFSELKFLFERFEDNPFSLEKALEEYRFAFIEGHVDTADFFLSNAFWLTCLS